MIEGRRTDARRWRGRPRRLAAVVLGALVVLLATAGPAAADPAGPTPYDSTATGIEGEGLPHGLEAEVFGGDAYVVLTVPAGVAVEVPGYDVDDPGRDGPPEQYLRFDPDGSVFVNLRSRTHGQNAERFGVAESALGANVDPDAPPDWEQVSGDGVYAWHDHRIHWMTPDLPQQVSAAGDAGQEVFDWRIPIVVDGQEAAVVGSLTYTPPSLRLAAVVAALAALAGVIAVGWRAPRRVAVAVLVLGVVAVAWSVARALEAPTGADLEVIQLVLPVGGLVGGLVALLAAGGRLGDGASSPTAVLGMAGLGGLALAVLGLLNAGAFTQPQLPTDLPSDLQRMLTGLVLGGGVGAVVVLLRDLLSGSVGIGLPDLPDLDEGSENDGVTATP